MALVTYRIAKWGSIMAVITVIVATSLSICGFINVGTYHNISGIGVWAGLTLYLPVVFGLLLMGTRHKSVAFLYTLVNIISFAVCLWSTNVTSTHVADWKKFYNFWDQGRCYERGDQCVCPEAFLADYHVSRCELYEFGHGLFIGMSVISGIGILTSLIGAIIGLVGICKLLKEEDDKPIKAPNA